jgi:hypothetical protein
MAIKILDRLIPILAGTLLAILLQLWLYFCDGMGWTGLLLGG